MSSSLVFSVLRTLPLNGSIAWYNLSLPCFADPPAESPSTKNNSFLVLSLDCAGASLPDKDLSLLFFFVPFLASSLAFLAASLAILLLNFYLLFQ